MTVETPSQPNLIDRAKAIWHLRLWHWCKRHPIWATILGFFLCNILYYSWLLHGWLPDVAVEGQIVDYDTKQPVAGAWVAIQIWADGRVFNSDGSLRWYLPEGAQTGMTSPASAVVRTDQDGRFYYRVSAYEAYQSRGYTQHGVNIGVYHGGYESVDAATGKWDRSSGRRLPFSRQWQYRSDPALKRVGNDIEARQKSRDDFASGVDKVVAPSDQTWDSWTRLAHAVTRDEINAWCGSTESAERDFSYAAFESAAELTTHQERLIQRRLTHEYDHLSQPFRNFATLRRYALYGAYHAAVPEFPWPEPYSYEPYDQAPPNPGTLTFSAEQKNVLCQTLRRQANELLQQSLSMAWPQWATVAHATANEAIHQWCLAPTEIEGLRSNASYYAVAQQVSAQQWLLQAKLRDPNNQKIETVDQRSAEFDQLLALDKQRRQSLPDFAWPSVNVTVALSIREIRGAMLPGTFSNEQQATLCDVLRRQSDQILNVSVALPRSLP